jgi:hypothetical protein
MVLFRVFQPGMGVKIQHREGNGPMVEKKDSEKGRTRAKKRNPGAVFPMGAGRSNKGFGLRLRLGIGIIIRVVCAKVSALSPIGDIFVLGSVFVALRSVRRRPPYSGVGTTFVING